MIKERDSLTDRCQEIKDSLIKNGWDEKFPLFLGSTGAHNQDPDATGFSSYNKKHKLIVITFHGSRNGSKNPFADTDGPGDWGANYAWQAKTAKELGIHYLPPDIQVHSGFGRNFSSVQEQIKKLSSLKISIPEGLASLHYGSKFRSSGFSFTPELLPGSLPDLLEAVEQGTEHRPSEVDGPSFFYSPNGLLTR